MEAFLRFKGMVSEVNNFDVVCLTVQHGDSRVRVYSMHPEGKPGTPDIDPGALK